VASKVFLHIGLPKTGTTYLQSILWGSQDQLRDDGILLPGKSHRVHLWAALDVQGRKGLASRHRRAPGSWKRLVKQLASWDGTGVVSHEFLSGASARHASQAIADLAPAEVHVVVTARDSLGMLTAGWQEYVKNGGTLPVSAMGDKMSGPGSEFGWRTWDLRGVLRRWTPDLPPERVHILPLPQGGEPDQHWRNFAGVIGATGDYPIPERPANTSLGVVQVELLRRVNAHLGDFRSALDRGRWIRGYLAEEMLSMQERESLGLDEAAVEECRERADRAVRFVRRHGFHVVGDLDSLLVPAEVPARRGSDTVAPDELIDAAGRLVADMLADVRARIRGGAPDGSTTVGQQHRS
jgi:hypothetical protein